MAARALRVCSTLLLFTILLQESYQKSVFSDEIKEQQDFCQLPKEAGLCEGLFTKWFYNATANHCQKFTYGGCGGNANRFDTKRACKLACKGGSSLKVALDMTPAPPKGAPHHTQSITPPCQEKLQAVLANGTLIGAYIPKCEKNGYYEPVQCWGSVGSCWCVTPDGKHLDATPPICQPSQSLFSKQDISSSRCFRQVQQAIGDTILIHGWPIPIDKRIFIPKCDPKTGYFQLEQCSRESQCWCVDKFFGNQIKNTEHAAGDNYTCP
ncbi:papilin isoform X2 [Nematostella vectensis]|uniref:papilin isoform X2 n=1 Tax=Nematostella vectensis TaxID=45351 RepID=UPI0013903399|nr:papilin isoform X2 [Nematostella vectensis]